MPPRPSTAVPKQSTQLQPHSDSHDINGDDPVLNQIIYHGGVELGSPVALTGSSADIAGLSMTVRTRGGALMVLFTGERNATFSGTATSATITVGVETSLIVGLLNIAAYNDTVEIKTANAETQTLSGEWPGTLTWIYTPLQGEYTVKIKASFISDSTAGNIDTGCNLQVFELLPLRRD